MNRAIAPLTVAIVVALAAGSAQAGVKDWLRDKKNKITGKEDAAQITDAERADCAVFLADYDKGRIPKTQANDAKNARCSYVAAQPKEDATTLPTVEVKGERPAKEGRVDRKKVTKEAAKGCAVGALMSLLGGGLDIRSCAAGALAGGIQSWQEQMAEARAVEAAAKQAGMQAEVTSTTETVKGKQVEKLQGVVINYSPDDMARMDDKTRALLDRVATLAMKSKNQLTFTFDGTAKFCPIPLNDLKRRGVLDRHTIENHCGRQAGGKETLHRIVITPVPEID